jgi:hypothetical protein
VAAGAERAIRRATGAMGGMWRSIRQVSIHEKVLILVVGFDVYRLAATEILGFSGARIGECF